jgi:hypothetical protein
MTDPTSTCPDCGTTIESADNYCRQCGMYLVAARDLPVAAPAGERALVASRPGLPAPARKVATAVAIGTVLQFGLGVAGRYLARQAARQAAVAVQANARERTSRGQQQPGEQVVARDHGRGGLPDEETGLLTETLVIRRVWLRRG